VKLLDLLKKVNDAVRPAHVHKAKHSDSSVDDEFTQSWAEGQASWIPSQQDRPRH
jgi:hypothetical protein